MRLLKEQAVVGLQEGSLNRHCMQAVDARQSSKEKKINNSHVYNHMQED